MSQNKVYKLKVTCKQEGIEYESTAAERSSEDLQLVKEGIKKCHRNEVENFEIITDTGFVTIPGHILSKCIFELIEVKDDN